MEWNPEQLTAAALQLPTHLRAQLAQALIASLDEDAELDREWLAEVERRDADLESGRAQGIPADEVFRAARARLAERRRGRSQ